MTYTLALSAVQLDVLVRALDLYERVGMGQFKEVIRAHGAPFSRDANDLAEELMVTAKTVLRPELGLSGYYGIRSPEIRDSFRIAYDLEQVIRYRLHHDRGGGTWSTWAATPWASSAEPLASIASVG